MTAEEHEARFIPTYDEKPYKDLVPLLFDIRAMIPNLQCPECGIIGRIDNVQVGPTLTVLRCLGCMKLMTVPGEIQEAIRRTRAEAANGDR